MVESRSLSHRQSCLWGLTCYFQLQSGFFIKIPIFNETLVLSLIAQPGPEDPQGNVSIGDTPFQKLCSPLVLGHLGGEVVLPTLVEMHIDGKPGAEPPHLHVLGVHLGGEVTGQNDVPSHGGRDGVIRPQDLELGCKQQV